MYPDGYEIADNMRASPSTTYRVSSKAGSWAKQAETWFEVQLPLQKIMEKLVGLYH